MQHRRRHWFQSISLSITHWIHCIIVIWIWFSCTRIAQILFIMFISIIIVIVSITRGILPLSKNRKEWLTINHWILLHFVVLIPTIINTFLFSWSINISIIINPYLVNRSMNIFTIMNNLFVRSMNISLTDAHRLIKWRIVFERIRTFFIWKGA